MSLRMQFLPSPDDFRSKDPDACPNANRRRIGITGKYGIKSFVLCDDNLFAMRKQAKELLRQMADRKPT